MFSKSFDATQQQRKYCYTRTNTNQVLVVTQEPTKIICCNQMFLRKKTLQKGTKLSKRKLCEVKKIDISQSSCKSKTIQKIKSWSMQ